MKLLSRTIYIGGVLLVLATVLIVARQFSLADSSLLLFFVLMILGMIATLAQEIECRQKVLALSAEIGRSLTRIDLLRNMLCFCTNALTKHLKVKYARIWTVEEGEKKYLSLQGKSGDCLALDTSFTRIAFSETCVGEVAAKRKAMLSNKGNKGQEIFTLGQFEWAAQNKIVGFAATPLLVEGELVGVMAIFASRLLEQADLSAMEAVADTIALGIERKRNEQELNRTAEALRESERFHNLAIQGSQEGIWDWNIVTDEHYYSAKCKEQLGYAASDVDDANKDLLKSIVHPDDLGKMLAAVNDHLIKKTPYDLKYRVRAQDGTYRWIHSRGQAVWDEQGKPLRMAGFHWDITERIEQEELLKESERRFRAIFDQTFQFVGILSPEGILLEANRGALEFEDVIQEDVIGQYFWDTPWWKRSKAGQEKLKKAIKEAREGDFVRFEADHVGPQGTITVDFSLKPVFDEAGKVVMIIPEGRDITQRICAERALAEREARTRAILDTAAEGIITITDRGVIESANNAAHLMFSYGRGELIGRNVIDILPDFFALGRLARARSFRATGSGEHRLVGSGFETAGKRFDGTKLPVEIALSVGEAGGQLIITGILRDITERKDVERRVREFYSMVSHELRTPLTSIRGSLSLMEGGRAGELPPRAVQLVKIAHAETERLIRLINDILDIRKIEAGKLELNLREVDVSELVNASLEGMRGMAEQADVKLIARVTASGKLACDRDRISQVLTNLLANAVKFSPPQSEVIVTVTKTESNDFRCSIKDSGPGIPESQRHKLFGLFQQLDLSDSRPKEGSGLGLAISKGIIEQHKGRIGMESAVGAGSTFWFELPGTVRSAPVVVTTMPMPTLHTALIVDSDKELCKTLGIALKQEGFKLSEVDSPEAGEHWLTTEGHPDVIIADIRLANGKRRAFLERLGRHGGGGKIPIVVLTQGKADPELLRHSLLVDWIEKPVAIERLLSSLRIAVRRRISGPARVLIVEDDQTARGVIRHELESINVECIEAADGITALRLVRQRDPDLIVLAVPLAGLDGSELIRVLKKERSQNTPLIVYTAVDLSDEDKKKLTLGVTAHLVKSRTAEEDLVETAKSMLNGLIEKAEAITRIISA